MSTYFLMTPHAHCHLCTPPVAPVHHGKAGIPPFCVLVNLSYLVILGGKRSIIDRDLPFAQLTGSPIREISF